MVMFPMYQPSNSLRLQRASSSSLAQRSPHQQNKLRAQGAHTVINAQQSSAQREHFVRDLYTILFQFIVETFDYRLEPSSKDPLPSTQIIPLDQGGYQARGPARTTSISLTRATPLISAYGQNGFDEFCINFTDELLQSNFVHPAVYL